MDNIVSKKNYIDKYINNIIDRLDFYDQILRINYV